MRVSYRRTDGLSILEVVVALALLGLVLGGVLPLLLVAQRAADRVRRLSMTQALASARLEQLQALTWSLGVDASGVEHEERDTTTDLSGARPGGGGPGLQESDLASLTRDTGGYADFLDARGRWLGSGAAPPLGTRYVRRWAVTRPACGTDGAVAVHVIAFAWPARSLGRVPTEPEVALSWLAGAKARSRR